VINATSYAVQGWAELEKVEGIPCPKIALMMGEDNVCTSDPPVLLSSRLGSF